MENLPIDIHSTKLLDWLISRRHCSKDWQKEVYKIREKINHAIQDMPEHKDIVELLSGTYINYFHCERIVEILKQTEADSKNIFGYYSSQRMKDWNEIIKLYGKDNVYLGEAAQILQRLVMYEIPGIKKQIAKSTSSQEECEKKENEYARLSKESERTFNQECLKMGISPDLAKEGKGKIRSELLRLVENLPGFFEKLERKIKNLSDGKDFYVKFRQYLLKKDKEEENLLPVLSYLQRKGNTTFYEWKNGKKPERVEPFTFSVEEETVDDTIDFGFDDGEISFDQIQTVESGIEISVLEHNTPQAETESDSVARGFDTFTVLEHSDTRKLLLQDLLELEAFLSVREMDLSTEHPSDFILASQGSRTEYVSKEVGDAVNREVGDIRKYLSQTEEILNELRDSNRRHLFKIRSSPSYLESLSEEVERKRLQSGKYVRLGELMVEKKGELRQEALSLTPTLALLVKRTKELQKQLEEDISTRYNGRNVNIMGSITTVI